jgi:hypothetical protein
MWIVCCNIATEKWLGGTPLERSLWGEITPVSPLFDRPGQGLFFYFGLAWFSL